MVTACGERKRTCFAVKADDMLRDLRAAFHRSCSPIPHSQPLCMQETSGSSCLLPPPLLPLNTHIRYVSTRPGSFFRARKLQFGGDGRSFPAADSCGCHARHRCKLLNISPTHTTSLMLQVLGACFCTATLLCRCTKGVW